MAPRGCRLAGAVCAAVLAVTAAGPVRAQAAGSTTAGPAAISGSAAQMLASAKSLWAKGAGDQALDVLRSLKSRYPSSVEASDALALSIEITLSMGDVFRARYLFSSLTASYPRSTAIWKTAFAIAEYCYRNNLPAARDYYLAAVKNEERTSAGPDVQRARLRAAELSLYQAADAETARWHLGRVVPAQLSAEDLSSYRALSIRLRWEAIPSAALGLSDSNISFLLADGGDVWVGTWNGGVARYASASRGSTPFTQAAVTSRSASVMDRRIWVGTSEGLSWFSKPSGRWGMEDEFGPPSARNVKALCTAGGALYAGTLGDGLFRLRGSTWERVGSDAIPGPFITCLFPDEKGARLYIGTMEMGPFVLDMGTDRITRLGSPDLSSLNVTTILRDEYGTVWIGTYGGGLYAQGPGAGGLRHFGMEGGQIADDWILSAAETPRALYFGTFGGGVCVWSKEDESWSALGIADGLPSLDITSIASLGPYVFFGTLGGGVVRYLEGAALRP